MFKKRYTFWCQDRDWFLENKGSWFQVTWFDRRSALDNSPSIDVTRNKRGKFQAVASECDEKITRKVIKFLNKNGLPWEKDV